MKKIFLTGVIVLSYFTATSVLGQETEFSLAKGKKELKHEKKELSTEEKGVRKEERAARHAEVRSTTMEEFEKDFPEAKNSVFTVGENFEEAYYELNGLEFIAFYDKDSKLVGTTTEKQMNDLPLRAQKIINNKYKNEGYSIDRIILFDDNEANTADMFLYNKQFNDEDNYFVELKKAGKTLILQIDMNGNVSFFKNI